MRLRNLPAISIWLPLVLLFSVWCAHAEEDEPRILKSTPFDTRPVNLQYFEDSGTILVLELEQGILWRSDDAGKNWKIPEEIKKGQARMFWLHPNDKQRAYVFGNELKHWVTTDRGKSWKEFDLPDGAGPSDFHIPLAFHAGNPEKVIFNAQECRSILCDELAYYTEDDFDTVKLLRKETRGCTFAHATPEFHAGDDKEDDRVLCVARGKYSPWPKDNRLLVSDDFFRKHEEEPRLDGDRTVPGIINMAVVKGFMVTAAKSETTSELAMYVSHDAREWHRAEFPQTHKLEEDAYTILESTNYSIQVDVMTTSPANPMGVLFSSNSNGTYFTENTRYTNRNPAGIVDFEKVAGIQGIVLVNTVDNWDEVERNRKAEKRIKSKISFDDGRTFQELTVGQDDKRASKELHLHSVTEMANVGRIFSSPAPGIVMGVGNTGGYLKSRAEGDLYVSDNAGLSWRKAIEGSHKYEFGDQGGVLVAVSDSGPTDKLKYSIDHGREWTDIKLGKKVIARILTTTPDSTSRRFVLEATEQTDDGLKYLIYAIDLNGLEIGECNDDDFEPWSARSDKEGNSACLMGHTQEYRRRKWDSKCFVGEKHFKEAVPKTTPCQCTDEDFECDYNFVPDFEGKDKKCKPTTALRPPKGSCKKKGDTFKDRSGFVKIPGNDCTGEDKVGKSGEIDRPCEEFANPRPSDGTVSREYTAFEADRFLQKIYLERSLTSSGVDETLVMSVRRGPGISIWLSKNQGKEWMRLLEDVDDILYIVPHQYEHDRFFVITGGDEGYVFSNRGDTMVRFKQPSKALPASNPLSFHYDEKEWLIWTGAVNCEKANSPDCRLDSYYSTDRGYSWEILVRYCQKCEFIKKEGTGGNDHLVYCEQHKDEKPEGALELRSSSNWFADSVAHFDDILTFATMSEFIIVALKDPESNLKVEASIDGKTFADAQFPKGFNVPHRTAYTVLDSSTNSVFLHVTVGSMVGFEYGKMMKSNSNGTNYVLSIDAVNRDDNGYVDFEKMQGIEGVALVNVVANLEDENSGKPKKLRSLITHNDGAQWAPLKAPETTDEGKAWGCDVNDVEHCSLHLHSYTEREDPKDTFSSPSAVGLMLGVGNVGPYQTWKKGDDVYTFVTRDGGVSWKVAKKGNYMWEYGDQGSIIVIVEESDSTNVGFYSLDEGEHWEEFKFADRPMRVTDLTTVPSDSSVNFIIWVEDGPKIATITVDFEGVRKDRRQCTFDENQDHDDDFELWSPKHPLQEDKCLFGRRTQYHRKKLDADCWIKKIVPALHKAEIENCTCTAQDFEWYVLALSFYFHSSSLPTDHVMRSDYNFERKPDNTCQLVEGLERQDHSQVCVDDPSRKSYFSAGNYRKIPISSCHGGEETKYLGEEVACPGHEDELEQERGGLSGFAFFLVAIVLPIFAAAGIGYWVYSTWERGGFGRIRLGDSYSAVGGGTGSMFDAERPWVKYPVAGVAALVAVAATIPLVAGAGWRFVSGLFRGRGGAAAGGRYTTRQSFARGRGDYAVVDLDEDELLGGDDDDEV